MNDWFSTIAAGTTLSPAATRDLLSDGFVTIPGPVPKEKLARLTESYDTAMAKADPDDISIGSSTTRVHDLVNRGEAFDELYVYPPVLEACCKVIGQPFQLSTMLARTLRPLSVGQEVHVDLPPEVRGWFMVGFIFMVDEFRLENGATCFVPGSQASPMMPTDPLKRLVPACGPAGSMIVFNGSVWHGHGINETEQPRRSIQGAYIPRGEKRGIDMASRMRPETLRRIGSLAKYLVSG